MRKPLVSTINTMSMSWAGKFVAKGGVFNMMQGAFKFLGKGADYSEELMSLAVGITHSPLLLARNSLAIVIYSIYTLPGDYHHHLSSYILQEADYIRENLRQEIEIRIAYQDVRSWVGK
ncbi:hypothetical protein BDR03DRAFT_1041168 [Suillus americanus]|nr:hypothetical protein BDR03DRAFT_1041168 [Suillus americanus]